MGSSSHKEAAWQLVRFDADIAVINGWRIGA
jgi:hypothetical protein